MQIRFDSPVVAESGMMRIREVQIFVGGRLPLRRSVLQNSNQAFLYGYAGHRLGEKECRAAGFHFRAARGSKDQLLLSAK